MLAAEPRLSDLARLALSAHYSHERGAWLKISAALDRLVGPLSGHPRLRGREHYRAARDYLMKLFTTGDGNA